MNTQGLQQILTTIFMLLAIAAIVVFFVLNDRFWFYSLGITAVVIRLVQYVIKIVERKKRRKRKIDFDFENNKSK